MNNSHAHLSGTGVPGGDDAEHTDPTRATTRLGDHLACGVTIVADLFGHPPAMLARRAAAAASPGSLPRILVSGQGITSPGGHPTRTAYAWSQTLATSAALETDDPAEARAHVSRLREADRGLYMERYSGHLSEYLQAGVIIGAAGNGGSRRLRARITLPPRRRQFFGEERGNRVYGLGGPPVGLPQLAQMISEVTGVKVTYRDLPAEEYARVLRRALIKRPPAS
jgi:hypothetical protein